MTKTRLSYVEYYDDFGIKIATNYTRTWHNFADECERRRLTQRHILRKEYNAKIQGSEVIFATEQDAVKFILRWS